MDSLVKQQSIQVRIIKKVAAQLSKDSTARKTREYGEARLHSINTAWDQIESLNSQMEVLRDQQPDHKYFNENYYAQVEGLYEQTREHAESIIREAIDRKKNSEEIAGQLRLIKKQTAIIETLIRNIRIIQDDLNQQQSSIYCTQKIKLINDYWEMIVHNHAEIMAAGRFKDDYFEKEVFSTTEELYQTAVINLQERIEQLSVTTAQPGSGQPVPSRTPIMDNSSAVKLPRIDIPNFCGDYLKWPSFRSLFMELIHKNEKITKSEKLFYLKANVVAEPNELIQHLNITNENYDTAWEILDRRYNNKRTLVSVQFRTLCNQAELSKESAAGLKGLHDTTLECLEAIKNLGIDTKTWDPLLIYLLVQKLDKESRRIYEQSLKNPRELQNLKEFLEFLENRFQSLESIEPGRHNSLYKQAEKRNDVKVHHGTVGKLSCTFCKADHKIYSCNKFANLNVHQRNEAIRKAKVCANCLVKGHTAYNCKSWRTCKMCGKKHHTLLHLTSSNQTANPNPQDRVGRQEQSTAEITSHVAESQAHHSVLLATAVLLAVGKNGTMVMLRALIDQGAQASFITEDAVQRLQIPKGRIAATVTGVGESRLDNIKSYIQLTIKPRFESEFSTTTTALVLNKLTRLLPSETISPKITWTHTKNIMLADPKFDAPGKIDIILGAEVFGRILLGKVLRGPPGSPIAQETELGWILSGEVQQGTSSKRLQCYISEVDLNKELRKFWELEELNTNTVVTSEDVMCETHYRTTYKRGADGQYVVRLPFKKDPERSRLGGSRELAVARLLQMERKFKTNKAFETLYKEFMKEYLQLGHMIPVTEHIDTAYYLPHHAVIKEDSTTTKLRVVFDGTAKRQNHESLNEILLTGPQIQQNLISILLRWRKHKIVFTSDIEKMYRQIKVDVRDQNYQRILWRNSPDEPIKEFNLTTVTYGTASAPFLAIRTLQQLAKDTSNDFPLAERAIMRDTYVDDIVSGGDSLEEAIEISSQLINSLKSGGFNLRKWNSNNRHLLRRLPWQLREVAPEFDFDQERSIKALGVHWTPSTDLFKIKVNTNDNKPPTSKRELLSQAAKIFDPIGLLAPITISIKLLFQELWTENVDWDEPLTEEVNLKWKRINAELPCLMQIQVPRWIGYSQSAHYYELHGFSDASEKAYSAAIYFRTICGEKTTVSLLTAKTKVAPLKSKLSLPRLELCGATLLAKLLKETIDSLEIPDLPYYAWTDSKIVLSWIRQDPHKWKTFVGNRVAEIQSATSTEIWHYVKSAENPADIASRGVPPSKLKTNALWWEGPQWLKDNQVIFPASEIEETELEQKRPVVNTVTVEDNENRIESLLQKVSSLRKLLRIIAYCKRFINNAKKSSDERDTGLLSVEEVENAALPIIQITQKRHFKEEMESIRKGQQLSKSSRLISLNPFLDGNGIIRVGGRLGNSNLDFAQKHPIIMPHKDELITLIIDEAHNKTLHGGNALTLEIIRQRYWILNGLKAVKGHIHKCVRCHRYKKQMSQQLMGMLPKPRVTPSRPFTHTGVDYAGPFDLLATKGRGSRTHKGYIAIFICLTTKAMHIEVVTDLTSSAFIAAFKRLVNRRGPVSHLYSDNATNFVGASKIISDLHQQDSYRAEVSEALREDGTQWHFIPPSSPHFGGLWEAGVKSVKHHMRRVINETRLTYEEMATLMTQIEACLNSRPLCPLSEDPDSLEVLTPGHFLTGGPILSLPGQHHLDTNPNLLKRWDRLDRMYQEFWKKWSMEYIGRLQCRPKWNQKQDNLEIGNLVLIKEDGVPPARWALGRIVATHPGADGLVRVVTLQTKTGNLKRPVVKLSLLPVINNNNEDESLTMAKIMGEDINECEDEEMPSGPTHSKVTTRELKNRKRTVTHTDESTEAKISRQNTRVGSSHHVHRPNFFSYLFIIATFFVIVLGENSNTPYKITTLKNHEGIYFDDISELHLYFSEWNLLVYYDLSTYWKEYYGIQRAIRRLSTLCDEEIRLSRDLCLATSQQFKHQLLETQSINELLYQQNENIRTRSKRAPFEIVGTVANKLFGILDQDFAEQYEKQIQEIKDNEKYARQLLKNQTTIIEATVNIMKKNHNTIQHQITMIENQIQEITKQLNNSQHEVIAHQTFNSAAILLTLCLTTLQNVQRGIMSVMMDIKHGKINTLLLTPAQLSDQLKIIREHLPPNVQLPTTGITMNLMNLYHTMHVKTRITENNVLFDIRIPLLSTESYRLYELIPIPTIVNDKYIYVDPSSKYLAINHRRDRFTHISEEDTKMCEALASGRMMCNLKHPVFTLRSNQSHCEIELLNNKNKISPFCKLKTKRAENQWRRLHNSNAWLFTLKEELHLELICGNIMHSLSLTGNGVIQLVGDCTINHQTLYIRSSNGQNELHLPVIPENAVLSNHVQISKNLSNNSTMLVIPHLMQEVDSADVTELENALKHQQQLITNMPTMNIHDLHHYGSIYLLICIVIGIIIYARCRRQGLFTTLGINARPTPAPRQSPQRWRSSLELPQINLEAGECSTHI